MAIGSVKETEVKEGLEVGEQICQVAFLSLVIMKLAVNEECEKWWLVLDLLTVLASFVGIHL